MLTASISMARSTPMTDAAHPMPDRLKVRMLLLNLKWFTTAADSEGVGLKAEQFTIRPSICTRHHATGSPLYCKKDGAIFLNAHEVQPSLQEMVVLHIVLHEV